MSALKPIKLKNYIITPDPEGKPLRDHPNELLEAMCDFEDKGERWSSSSRFTWWTELQKSQGGIPFGNALVALQYTIMNEWKVLPDFLVLIQEVDS
jgi:hypothetical protein